MNLYSAFEHCPGSVVQCEDSSLIRVPKSENEAFTMIWGPGSPTSNQGCVMTHTMMHTACKKVDSPKLLKVIEMVDRVRNLEYASGYDWQTLCFQIASELGAMEQ